MTANAYVTTSDRRLKRDILPSAGLAEIRKLAPVEFPPGCDARPARARAVAQDVQTVLPEAVHGVESLGIEYEAVVTCLVAAVQQPHARIVARREEDTQMPSDFGTLMDYAIELEAAIPPATLMAMESRPKFMRQFPEATLPRAGDTKETPRQASAGSKKDSTRRGCSTCSAAVAAPKTTLTRTSLTPAQPDAGAGPPRDGGRLRQSRATVVSAVSRDRRRDR